MATETVLERGCAALDDDRTKWSYWPLRIRLALVSSWEIEALADLLIRDLGETFEQEDRAARTVLQRVRALSGCILCALDDEHADQVAEYKRMFPDSEGDFGDLIKGAA